MHSRPPCAWCSHASPRAPLHSQELCTCSLQMALQKDVMESEDQARRGLSALLPAAFHFFQRTAARCSACPFVFSQPLPDGALYLQATVLSLLHQVACGLEYLHGLGIIHGGATV